MTWDVTIEAPLERDLTDDEIDVVMGALATCDVTLGVGGMPRRFRVMGTVEGIAFALAAASDLQQRTTVALRHAGVLAADAELPVRFLEVAGTE